ncbi:MAG: PLDc N-terminal domain-containing protein, partial [Clostridia bacterium]|nr:PLDc N-terminal domain-containing protein [Clostridia bacterium]
MKRLLRILFSRYTVSALIILLELACLIPSFWLTGGEIALALATPFSVLAIVSVINRDANPEFKVTWIIVISFIPYLGTLIYVLFAKRRLSKREMKMYRKILPKISVNDREGSGEALLALYEESTLAATKARAIVNDDFAARVCHSTNMTYYPSGEEMYLAMLDAIASAESFVFLEYFIIAQGKMWDGIQDLLEKKAREGVDVRVLYDDVGSMGTVPSAFPDTLRVLGIRCERFSPITPSISAGHNNRDHRKLMIIDGK